MLCICHVHVDARFGQIISFADGLTVIQETDIDRIIEQSLSVICKIFRRRKKSWKRYKRILIFTF